MILKISNFNKGYLNSAFAFEDEHNTLATKYVHIQIFAFD